MAGGGWKIIIIIVLSILWRFRVGVEARGFLLHTHSSLLEGSASQIQGRESLEGIFCSVRIKVQNFKQRAVYDSKLE